MLVREGWGPTVLALGAALTAVYLWGVVWSLPLWGLAVFVAVLFHDSRPEIPALPLALLSPVDGEVVSVGKTRDTWLDREGLSISIEMKHLVVSVLRSPTEGKVMKYLTNAANSGRASARSPTLYALWVQTDEGDDVVWSVSTRAFSRFKTDFGPGERVGQGRRCGFVYFGRTVEVLVPATSKCDLQVGHPVLAGSSVIATLVRQADKI